MNKLYEYGILKVSSMSPEEAGAIGGAIAPLVFVGTNPIMRRSLKSRPLAIVGLAGFGAATGAIGAHLSGR